MSKIKITIEEYEYHCGDGCCSEWGEDVAYEVDGELVGEGRLPGFDSQTAEHLLTALGYKVDDYNSDYTSDGYIITAEKVN